jgi:hypothetical protein
VTRPKMPCRDGGPMEHGSSRLPSDAALRAAARPTPSRRSNAIPSGTLLRRIAALRTATTPQQLRVAPPAGGGSGRRHEQKIPYRMRKHAEACSRPRAASRRLGQVRLRILQLVPRRGRCAPLHSPRSTRMRVLAPSP